VTGIIIRLSGGSEVKGLDNLCKGKARYVPDANENLVSAGSLCDQSNIVVFNSKNASVFKANSLEFKELETKTPQTVDQGITTGVSYLKTLQ
jgi:hypothetical protein